MHTRWATQPASRPSPPLPSLAVNCPWWEKREEEESRKKKESIVCFSPDRTNLWQSWLRKTDQKPTHSCRWQLWEDSQLLHCPWKLGSALGLSLDMPTRSTRPSKPIGPSFQSIVTAERSSYSRIQQMPQYSCDDRAPRRTACQHKGYS